MNSLFGRININAKPIDQALFAKSMDQLAVFNKVKKEIQLENKLCFGQILFPPFSKSLHQDLNSNFIFISDSCIYNKHELAKNLNLSENQVTDDLVILKSYEKWGPACLNYLMGDFAFALWDIKKEELFCARDHFGVKPFNYYFDNEHFVFASDISSITEQSDLNLSINEQYIADSISIIKSEHSQTTYHEIRKLPPAHYLSLKGSKLDIKQYWVLKPKEILKKSNDEIIEEFKTLIIKSVKCRIEDRDNIGAELSGGIDSSSVTAIASQFKKLKTFSHVMPDHLLGKIHPFKDERDFINLLTDHSKISDRSFVRSEESLINLLNENVFDFKSIMQQNFGTFSDQLYQAAMQEHISVLLSGFGGDEVVSSKSLGYLFELAKNKQWDELKTDLRNQKSNKIKYSKALLKLFLSVKSPYIIKTLAFLRFNKPWWSGKFKNLAINPSFSKRLKIKNRYFKYYKNIKKDSSQEKNIERITHPHASQRLEYCSLIARKYGIEYRYPLLDKRLIEYYLSVPLRLKARNGIGRYIIRRAIEGLVPEKIQWRNDKSGATIPTVFMRMLNDKEKILEIIQRAKSNQLITPYIDLDAYEKWFHNFYTRSEKKKKNINPGAFYNYLKLILFIEQNPSLFE